MGKSTGHTWRNAKVQRGRAQVPGGEKGAKAGPGQIGEGLGRREPRHAPRGRHRRVTADRELRAKTRMLEARVCSPATARGEGPARPPSAFGIC